MLLITSVDGPDTVPVVPVCDIDVPVNIMLPVLNVSPMLALANDIVSPTVIVFVSIIVDATAGWKRTVCQTKPVGTFRATVELPGAICNIDPGSMLKVPDM